MNDSVLFSFHCDYGFRGDNLRLIHRWSNMPENEVFKDFYDYFEYYAESNIEKDVDDDNNLVFLIFSRPYKSIRDFLSRFKTPKDLAMYVNNLALDPDQTCQLYIVTPGMKAIELAEILLKTSFRF